MTPRSKDLLQAGALTGLAFAVAGGLAQCVEIGLVARPGPMPDERLSALDAVLMMVFVMGASVLWAPVGLAARWSFQRLALPETLQIRWLVGGASAWFAALLGAVTVTYLSSSLSFAQSERMWKGAVLLYPLIVVAFGIAAASLWRFVPTRVAKHAGKGSAAASLGLMATAGLLAMAAGGGLGLPHRFASVEAPARGQGVEKSVVLIVLDTTRADALDPYHREGKDTPYLSQLAHEGVTYEEFISAAPWTVPSHATMFTGLPPRSHGAWFGDRRWLADDYETVAEALKAKGHQTASFVSNGYVTLTNLLQGFDTQQSLAQAYDNLTLTTLMRATGIGPERLIDRGGVEAAVAIDEWMTQRDTSKPFFMFVNLFEAHDPYFSPIADRILPKDVGPLAPSRALAHYNDHAWHARHIEDGYDQKVIRALYRAGVRYQDRALRHIVETLGHHVDLDQVALVITADHGENMGEGGRWGHRFSLSEQLIHLPLIVRAPSRVKANSRVRGAFPEEDLAGTLMDLAGHAPTYGEGRSLLSDHPATATYAEVYPAYMAFPKLGRDLKTDIGDFRWPMSTVRADGYKLLVHHGGGAELFDLSHDAREEHDVSKQRPETAARLSGLLEDWLQAHGSSGTVAGAVKPTGNAETETPGDHAVAPEVVDKLRALGYL